MESVETATSEATTSPDLVVKCLTVVTGRPVVLGFLSLSALKAFDSTDETLKAVIDSVARLIEICGEGDTYVGLQVARALYDADLINKMVGDSERRYYIVDAEEALLRNRIKYVMPHSPGKSEALGRAKLYVGEGATVSTKDFNFSGPEFDFSNRELRIAALQATGTIALPDDFTKQLQKFVDAMNKAGDGFANFHEELVLKKDSPNRIEKPYGKAHRRRFRR